MGGGYVELDLVIKNGWVVDGLSSSLYKGVIGIAGEKIDCIRDGSCRLQGRKMIDARDLCVTPGFIDAHSHVDHFLFLDPVMEHKLVQGVTTEIGGNCGSSAYPWNGSHLFSIPGREQDFSWPSFGAFLEALEERSIAFNFGSLVGHNSLRGNPDTRGTSCESNGQKELKQILSKSLEEGALGLSTGNGIPRGFEGPLSEIGELAKIVAKKNGVLSMSLRNEANEILEALTEALLVASQSDVSLQISHFKTLDRMHWSKQERALELIEKMRLVGMNINTDSFPYTVGCAPLRVAMPPRLTLDEKKFREQAARPSVRLEVEEYVSALFPKPYSYRNITFPYLESPRYQHLRGMNLCGENRPRSFFPSQWLKDCSGTFTTIA
jgi:N-acyl-D-amino-acid deacylase